MVATGRGEVPAASSEELASLVNEGQDPLDYDPTPRPNLRSKKK